MVMQRLQCIGCLVRQAMRKSTAQATARVLEAMARKGMLVQHLRGLLQQTSLSTAS